MRLWAVMFASLAACTDPGPPPPAEHPETLPGSPDEIVAVGTGSMTPLAERLAAAWAARGGSPKVVVEPSVGSGGGVRACADGAVDLGMVSRPLGEAERRLGLEVFPVARDAVVLAASERLPISGIGSAELTRLYRGEAVQLPDGRPLVLLLRDPDETANAVFERVYPGLRPLREEATRSRRLRVLFHDDAMGAALVSTLGGVGLHSLGGVVTSPYGLKALELDGVRPTVEAMAEGRWAPGRDLFFVARPERRGHVQPFLDFVGSPEGRRVVRESGYLPVERSP